MRPVLFLLFLWLGSANMATAQSKMPEDIIADIYKILNSESPETVTSKYLSEIADDKESQNMFNSQFRSLHDNLEKGEGFDIIEKTRYSDNLIAYKCIFRYQIPIYFRFLFYKYEGQWKITYFYFSDKVAKNLGLDTD